LLERLKMLPTFLTIAGAWLVGQLPRHDCWIAIVRYASNAIGAGYDGVDDIAIHLLHVVQAIEARRVIHKRVPVTSDVGVEHRRVGKPGYVLRHAAGPLPEIGKIEHRFHIA